MYLEPGELLFQSVKDFVATAILSILFFQYCFLFALPWWLRMIARIMPLKYHKALSNPGKQQGIKSLNQIKLIHSY